MTRRGRALSPEERALWEQVAASTTPLRPRPKSREPDSAVSEPSVPDGLRAAAAPRTATAMRPPKPAATPKLPALAPLDRRHRQKLVRGTSRIDARIDLHGLTQHQAYDRLRGFLHMAQASGYGTVLIITGKGGEAGPFGEGRGILRRRVPQWLALPDFRALVIGYDEAHLSHGGAGALYVRIRKARRKGEP